LGVSSRSEFQRALRHRSAIRPRSTTTWSAPWAVRQRLTARPAWPAPTIRVSTARMVLFPLRWSWSGGRDVDADRHAVGQHVVHGGPGHGLLHQLAQRLGRRVAAYPEADPDLAEAVADLVRQAEDPAQVDVALHPGLDRFQVDLADRGDVTQARGQARRQRREQELGRRRRGVPAHQHRGVVRLDGERAVVLLLGAYAVERADLVPVVRARDPAVGHAEPEAGRLGVRLDGIERCEQLGHIDAVALGLGCDSSHCLLLLSITEWT